MIAQEQLQSMISFVEQKGLDEATLSELRQQYSGVHFTWCWDDDINYEHPEAERSNFNVFLVDSSDHCSTLTKDSDSASGVVFAEIIE